MRISVDRVETVVVRLPARSDFRWLSLSRPLGEFVLLRLSGDGVEGWGEVVGLRNGGAADGRAHGEPPAAIGLPVTTARCAFFCCAPTPFMNVSLSQAISFGPVPTSRAGMS